MVSAENERTAGWLVVFVCLYTASRVMSAGLNHNPWDAKNVRQTVERKEIANPRQIANILQRTDFLR